MDYILPVPTPDRSGFCPRPCSNGQALRWLRLLRARKDRDEQEIKKLTLASFRVWMADLAYQASISRDKRRYIGRWASENTAHTYTREHRQVICSIWQEVTQKIHSLKGGRAVPEDLNHANWNTTAQHQPGQGMALRRPLQPTWGNPMFRRRTLHQNVADFNSPPQPLCPQTQKMKWKQHHFLFTHTATKWARRWSRTTKLLARTESSACISLILLDRPSDVVGNQEQTRPWQWPRKIMNMIKISPSAATASSSTASLYRGPPPP